jgi:hypothetical protein
VKKKWKEDMEIVDLASAGQEKCTTLHALIVVLKLKYRSSQLKEDLFIAGIATKSTRTTDQVDLTSEEKTMTKHKSLTKNKITATFRKE